MSHRHLQPKDFAPVSPRTIDSPPRSLHSRSASKAGTVPSYEGDGYFGILHAAPKRRTLDDFSLQRDGSNQTARPNLNSTEESTSHDTFGSPRKSTFNEDETTSSSEQPSSSEVATPSSKTVSFDGLTTLPRRHTEPSTDSVLGPLPDVHNTPTAQPLAPRRLTESQASALKTFQEEANMAWKARLATPTLPVSPSVWSYVSRTDDESQPRQRLNAINANNFEDQCVKWAHPGGWESTSSLAHQPHSPTDSRTSRGSARPSTAGSSFSSISSLTLGGRTASIFSEHRPLLGNGHHGNEADRDHHLDLGRQPPHSKLHQLSKFVQKRPSTGNLARPLTADASSRREEGLQGASQADEPRMLTSTERQELMRRNNKLAKVLGNEVLTSSASDCHSIPPSSAKASPFPRRHVFHKRPSAPEQNLVPTWTASLNGHDMRSESFHGSLDHSHVSTDPSSRAPHDVAGLAKDVTGSPLLGRSILSDAASTETIPTSSRRSSIRCFLGLQRPVDAIDENSPSKGRQRRRTRSSNIDLRGALKHQTDPPPTSDYTDFRHGLDLSLCSQDDLYRNLGDLVLLGTKGEPLTPETDGTARRSGSSTSDPLEEEEEEAPAQHHQARRRKAETMSRWLGTVVPSHLIGSSNRSVHGPFSPCTARSSVSPHEHAWLGSHLEVPHHVMGRLEERARSAADRVAMKLKERASPSSHGSTHRRHESAILTSHHIPLASSDDLASAAPGLSPKEKKARMRRLHKLESLLGEGIAHAAASQEQTPAMTTGGGRFLQGGHSTDSDFSTFSSSRYESVEEDEFVTVPTSPFTPGKAPNKTLRVSRSNLEMLTSSSRSYSAPLLTIVKPGQRPSTAPPMPISATLPPPVPPKNVKEDLMVAKQLWTLWQREDSDSDRGVAASARSSVALPSSNVRSPVNKTEVNARAMSPRVPTQGAAGYKAIDQNRSTERHPSRTASKTTAPPSMEPSTKENASSAAVPGAAASLSSTPSSEVSSEGKASQSTSSTIHLQPPPKETRQQQLQRQRLANRIQSRKSSLSPINQRSPSIQEVILEGETSSFVSADTSSKSTTFESLDNSVEGEVDDDEEDEDGRNKDEHRRRMVRSRKLGKFFGVPPPVRIDANGQPVCGF